MCEHSNIEHPSLDGFAVCADCGEKIYLEAKWTPRDVVVASVLSIIVLIVVALAISLS